MAQIEIIEKLHQFLEGHLPFLEECQVVYLLVEARKILDREDNHEFPILRFYCNWSVHTDKNPTREMTTIMDEIYKDVVTHIKLGSPPSGKPKIISFMYMEGLHGEMKRFLKERKLPTALTSNDNRIAFVALLVNILVDQPIKNPFSNIQLISFLSAANGCVRGRIDFAHTVEGEPSFNFGNAY